MPVTIKDVARLANVSPSTVTRVIQNKSSISDATKKRVRHAMKELNYHPNLNARSLVSNRSQVIGLVLPNDSDAFYQNPFFPQVLRGISLIASEHHYAIQIATGMTEEERLQSISQMVFGQRVDGLIFLYARENDPLVNLAIEQQFPFLILGKNLSPFVTLVDNDNLKAGFDATEYFLKQGLSSIAFLGGNRKLFVTKDRYDGYKKALEQYDIEVNKKLVHFANEFLIDEGYSFMEKLAEKGTMPEAIVTTDSLLADGVTHYITEQQINCQVLSFDSVDPRLNIQAYIDINTLELGRVSFKTILQIIEDSKAGKQIAYRQLIPHQIVEKHHGI